MKRSIYIGWDAREMDAYRVAWRSIVGRATQCPIIHPIMLSQMRVSGHYWRDHDRIDGRLWDVISEAPMSTEFALSRFLTPILAQDGWALFMDCDMLARADIGELFALADPEFAVQCVKHFTPSSGAHATGSKMDGQMQTSYRCKNWSSVMLFNCDHPANQALTLDLINTVPGRDLHAFCWLDPKLIGALPPQWNHLVGVDSPDPGAKLAHFTLGVPSMKGYEDSEFANEWRTYL